MLPPSEIDITNPKQLDESELNPTVDLKSTFECSICFKTFKRKKNRDEHLNIHSGQKPFQCTLCPKKFTGSSNLTTHNKRQHGKTGQKLRTPKKEIIEYSESESDATEDSHTYQYKFPKKCMASTSKNVHKEKRHSHLETQEEMSENEYEINNPVQPNDSKLIAKKKTKPTFECRICFKKFGRKRARDEHVSIHSGERPFQCELCPKNFVRSSTLRTHMQKYHEIETETAEVDNVDSVQSVNLELNSVPST